MLFNVSITEQGSYAFTHCPNHFPTFVGLVHLFGDRNCFSDERNGFSSDVSDLSGNSAYPAVTKTGLYSTSNEFHFIALTTTKTIKLLALQTLLPKTI